MQPLQQRTASHLNLPYLTAQQLIQKFQLKSPARTTPHTPTLTLQLNFKSSSKQRLRCMSPPLMTCKHSHSDKKELFKSSLSKAVHKLNAKAENKTSKRHIILPVKKVLNKNTSQIKQISSPKMSSRLASSGCMSKASISLQATHRNCHSELVNTIVPRKHSTASTEARSRHALSQQQLDQQYPENLFPHRNLESQQLTNVNLESGRNLVSMLQEAKKKLYQQIYALDQKLIVEKQIKSCSKKQIVISLRKGVKERLARVSE